MPESGFQRVIDELQRLIDDTQATLRRAEAYGLNVTEPEDYARLLDILERALEQQFTYRQRLPSDLQQDALATLH